MSRIALVDRIHDMTNRVQPVEFVIRSKGELQKTANGSLFVSCQTSQGVVPVWGSPGNRRNIDRIERLSLPVTVKANCIPSNWSDHAWWLPERSTVEVVGDGPGQGRGGKTSSEAGPSSEQRSDPYDVLGIRRGASMNEIKAAYRSKIREYHPDQVQRLGPELRDLAKRKTQEINRAYEQLVGGAKAT